MKLYLYNGIIWTLNALWDYLINKQWHGGFGTMILLIAPIFLHSFSSGSSFSFSFSFSQSLYNFILKHSSVEVKVKVFFVSFWNYRAVVNHKLHLVPKCMGAHWSKSSILEIYLFFYNIYERKVFLTQKKNWNTVINFACVDFTLALLLVFVQINQSVVYEITLNLFQHFYQQTNSYLIHFFPFRYIFNSLFNLELYFLFYFPSLRNGSLTMRTEDMHE